MKNVMKKGTISREMFIEGFVKFNGYDKSKDKLEKKLHKTTYKVIFISFLCLGIIKFFGVY